MRSLFSLATALCVAFLLIAAKGIKEIEPTPTPHWVYPAHDSIYLIGDTDTKLCWKRAGIPLWCGLYVFPVLDRRKENLAKMRAEPSSYPTDVFTLQDTPSLPPLIGNDFDIYGMVNLPLTGFDPQRISLWLNDQQIRGALSHNFSLGKGGKMYHRRIRFLLKCHEWYTLSNQITPSDLPLLYTEKAMEQFGTHPGSPLYQGEVVKIELRYCNVPFVKRAFRIVCEDEV